MKRMVVPYSRHYCKECDQRVFPYDSLERLTEAPGLGVSGRKVLLSSLNARRQRLDPDDPHRVAWCWTCGQWTDTYRETLEMIVKRYAKRRGVTYREQPARRKRQAKILRMKRSA
jgi:hypothetical protein